MMDGSERVLIIKLSSIGDVVHTLPFLEVLRSNYPRLKIDWCVDEEAYPIIEGNPYVNKIIISKRKAWKKKIFYISKWLKIAKEARSFLSELRKKEYDIVIDLQGLLKSGIIAGICKGNRKIGLNGAREYGWLFVNEIVNVDYNQHAIDRYLQVASYLGCSSLNWNWNIYISDNDKNIIDTLIVQINKNNLPLIAINPCARWKSKLWQMEKFSELTKRLINIGVKPVFLGNTKDKMIIDKILKDIKGAVNLSGALNLKQLAYFYSRCAAVVTVDTGPMHIAVLGGCKVISIFGPTDPKRTGPYGEGHQIIRANIPCSPCFKRNCKDMICMKEISVDMVMNSVIRVLSNNNRGA